MTFFSKKTYTATAGQAASKQFDIAFDLESGSAATASKPYLLPAHIKAKVDGAAVTDFTIDEVPAVSTLTFGATVTVNTGSVVEIYRETPRGLTDRTVDFTNASLLTEANLDQSAIHNQFLAQEALDSLLGALKEGVSGDLDAEARKIYNLATPVGPTDAVTKDYVDTQAVFAGAASAQAWEMVADGTTSRFQLLSPEPSATVNELFVVEVDGILQTPTSGGAVRDFRVYRDETDGSYYLEFEANSFPANVGNTNCPLNNSRVSAQNMGISKSALTGNVLFESSDTAASIITAKQKENQTADPFVIQDYLGATSFSVGPDGDITTKAGAAVSAGSVTLQPENDNTQGLIIKKSSGTQNANLLELQNASGNEIGTAFSSLGHLTIGTTTEDANSRLSLVSAQGIHALKISQEAGSTTDMVNVENSDGVALLRIEQDGTPASTWKLCAANRALRVYQDTSSGSEARHVVVTGGVGQTDAVFQVQTSSGVKLLETDLDGGTTVKAGGATSRVLDVRSTADSSMYRVDHQGYRYVNDMRVWSLARAGGFLVDGNSVGNETRISREYGEDIRQDSGHTWTYTRVSDTQTRVNFAVAMPDANYKVRAWEEHPTVHYGSPVGVTNKTTTGFDLIHTDEDSESGGYGCQVKWEVYI